MVSKALGETGVATHEAVLPDMGGRAREAVGESWMLATVGAQGKGSLLSPCCLQSINRQDLTNGLTPVVQTQGQQ